MVCIYVWKNTPLRYELQDCDAFQSIQYTAIYQGLEMPSLVQEHCTQHTYHSQEFPVKS